MMSFRTHTGEIVQGERLAAALSEVAEDWRRLARAIRAEDTYAPHVTDDKKQADMQNMLDRADEIERGVVGSFTIWQRINTKLTGTCVPLFG